MKKKRKFLAPLLAAVVVAAVAIGWLTLGTSQYDLTVNGQKVSKDEYLYVMNHQIYDVTRQFMSGGNQVNSEFWTKSFDGQVPYQVLADATLEQLRYNRAVYESAKELGYVDEVDYEHIVQRMEAENELRAQMIKNNEPVYGLSSFTIELYMEYEMDSFQKLYCNDLENPGMQITDADRQQYYDEHKDSLFIKSDDLTLDYIKIPYESEGLSEDEVDTLKDALIAIYKKVDDDHSLQSLVQQHSELSGYFTHQEMLSGEVSAMSKLIGDVLEYGYELDVGEASQVIDEYGCLYLIQCTSRVDYDYIPISEVKDNINKVLREERYEELMQQRAAQALVEGDLDGIYDFTKKSIN